MLSFKNKAGKTLSPSMSIVTNILFVPQESVPDVFGRNISAIKLYMSVSLNMGTFDPACGLLDNKLTFHTLFKLSTKNSHLHHISNDVLPLITSCYGNDGSRNDITLFARFAKLQLDWK